MHQMTTGIALYTTAWLFVYGILGENAVENDADLPSVNLETISVGNETANSSHSKNTTSESPLEKDENLAWLPDAIKDVAYYLRDYKFNEFDRRYETIESQSKSNYYKFYPNPPLRSLHWEVRKFCEPSFLSCMQFLIKKVHGTLSRRQDDTSVVINEQKWFGDNYTDQISAVDMECKGMKEKDEYYAKPFLGPIEKFQWRTTASYYLCWYAMNGVPELEYFQEACDNFSRCLDATFGPNNHDPRANDSKSFGCILYSICPDPCCPIRHISAYNECWDSEVNPCFQQDNPVGRQQRKCAFERDQNKDLTDLVLNRWNVTCECTQTGYVWQSRYGTCVDVNECATVTHTCDESRQVCLNLPGSYRCICNWGYIWSEDGCIVSDALTLIKKQREQKKTPARPSIAKSLIKWLFYKIFYKSDEND